MKNKNAMGWMWLACLLLVGALAGNYGVAKAQTNASDFVVMGGELTGYVGEGGEVVIPEGVVIIRERAFKDNDKITKVVFPSSVSSIGEEAFAGCGQLKEVSLNAGLLVINKKSFYGCGELVEITIPPSVTGISEQAFAHCPKLERILVSEGSADYSSADGVLVYLDRQIVAYPGGKKGDYIIPENIGGCFPYAFEGSAGLTGVTLTKQGKTVTEGLFKDCVNLANVTFPDGVTYLDAKAFEGCTGIRSIQMPNTLRSIGQEAFKDCTGITKVDFKSRLTEINSGAFSGCTSLAEFAVEKANTKYTALNGVLYNKKQTQLVLYPAGKKGAVAFAGSVTSIGDYAFEGCSALTEIQVPDRVEAIGDSAFKDCVGLKKVQLPASLTILRYNVFENCVGLTRVEIPGYVTRIYYQAFYGCENIKKMVIPASVKRIADEAFEGCDKLVIYGDAKSNAQKYAQEYSFGFLETVTKPAKLCLSLRSFAKKRVKASWKKAAKANGYVVQMSTKKGGGFKTIATLKKGSKVGVSKSGLKSGKRYYFRARSYKVVNKKTHYGAYSEVVMVKVK